MPGGPIEASAYSQMKTWVVDGLRDAHAACPLDGVWMDLHGAMFVEGLEDCEGDLLAAVRVVLGERPLLSVSFDLHGNFSERLAGLVDVCTGFRTAPHVDEFETELKALTLLMSCLRSGERPGLVYVKVPLAVSGEMSNTADEPSKSLYGTVLQEADRRPGVLDASLLIGYCWADEPRAGASVLVCGTDASICEAEALRIAGRVWSARAGFQFGVETGTPEEITARAQEAVRSGLGQERGRMVILSDSGDNPTGGGVGDTPSMLRVLVEAGLGGAVLQGPVDEAAVVACCAAGVGARVELSLGGKLDYVNETPFEVQGVVHYASAGKCHAMPSFMRASERSRTIYQHNLCG